MVAFVGNGTEEHPSPQPRIMAPLTKQQIEHAARDIRSLTGAVSSVTTGHSPTDHIESSANLRPCRLGAAARILLEVSDMRWDRVRRCHESCCNALVWEEASRCHGTAGGRSGQSCPTCRTCRKRPADKSGSSIR